MVVVEVIIMYEVDGEKIGKYLKKKIEEKYGKDRRFAIRYLQLRDKEKNPKLEDIQKMANKICQIKYGNKGIQISDLPFFAELLDVSVDEILSGGRYRTPNPKRLTNYSVAFSKDEKVWEKYVNNEDKLILNVDEYGKNVIDYALEFKNYRFLKYLMDNEYIYFIGKKKDLNICSFGAGTDIERRDISHTDILDSQMKERDDLRTSLISLAIENEDYDVLEELHSREIPALYGAGYLLANPMNIDKYRNEVLIDTVSYCGKDILEYFSQEFEVTNEAGTFTFTFPYLGELIDAAISNKNKNVDVLLKNASKHNGRVFEQVQCIADSIDEEYSSVRKRLKDEERNALIFADLLIFEENDTLCYQNRNFGKASFLGICTNIIKVTESSDDPKIQKSINKINAAYREIVSYKL